MTYNFKPKGVCAQNIMIDLSDDGVIREVKFNGGCSGNTSGISALVKGMKADEAAERLAHIDCRGKGTSCPDQLSKALREAIGQL